MATFSTLRDRVTRSFRELFLLDKDGQEILTKFESSLQESLVTSSYFDDILDCNLNRRQRYRQLSYIVTLLFYVLPVHVLQIIQYYMKDFHWSLFNTIFPDLLGPIKLAGPVLNHAYTAFVVNVTADKIFMWRFESKHSLEFLTDLGSLIKDRKYFGLNDEEIEKILSLIKKKSIYFRINMGGSVIMAYMIQTTGLLSLFFKSPPSPGFAVYSVLYLIIANYIIKMFLLHFYYIYLTYVIMTDCLNARIS